MNEAINARLSLLLLLIVVFPAPAAAQTASSFEQLALLVESGSRITVTDSAGSEQTGRIVALSPSAIELLVDGVRHDFRQPAADQTYPYETTTAGRERIAPKLHDLAIHHLNFLHPRWQPPHLNHFSP